MGIASEVIEPELLTNQENHRAGRQELAVADSRPTTQPTQYDVSAQRSAQKFRIVGWVKPQETEVRGILLQRLEAMTDTEGLALLDEVSNIFYL